MTDLNKSIESLKDAEELIINAGIYKPETVSAYANISIANSLLVIAENMAKVNANLEKLIAQEKRKNCAENHFNL